MKANGLANAGIVTQLAMVHTMLPKVKELIDQQVAEIEALKSELKRYADALGEERGNKALKNHEIAAVLTQVLDDCGLLKKDKP